MLRARYELGERLANYLVILVAVMLASLCVALLVSSKRSATKSARHPRLSARPGT